MTNLLNFEINLEEGEYLVNLARKSIEYALIGKKPPSLEGVSEKLKTDCGVFVTLNKINGSHHNLRGCIGFPYPDKSLVEAVLNSAESAALRDPRFPVVRLEEMDFITIEVSVLTPPEQIIVDSPIDIVKHIKIGRDGLIVGFGTNRGLLLPQVAVDWGWNSEEFLSQCCLKAYLPPDAWLLPETNVSIFRAIIFAEATPRGLVKEVELLSTY